MFCHVAADQVIGVHDVSSVYHVPLLLQSQGIVQYLQKRLDLPSIEVSEQMLEKGRNLQKRWRELTTRYVYFCSSFCSARRGSLKLRSQERVFDEVSVVLVGKYTDMKDSYMSVTKSLEHSAFRCGRKLVLKVRTIRAT